MSLTPPSGLEASDYDAIEEAVLETARGRWFLREFARRARAAETSRILDALARIEGAIGGHAPALEAAKLDIEDHAEALEQRHARLGDIAWMLRERGYDGDVCAMIEKEARAIGRLARTLRGGPAGEPARLASPMRASPERGAGRAGDAVTPPQPSEPEAPPAPAAPTLVEEPAPDPRAWRAKAEAALAPIDRMSPQERAAFFA